MSSLPLREKQLGLKESKRPSGDDNSGFKGYSGKPKPLSKYEDWEGTVRGKIKHSKGGYND